MFDLTNIIIITNILGQFIISLLVFVLTILTFKQYLHIYSIPLKWLTLTFFFLGLAIFIGVLPILVPLLVSGSLHSDTSTYRLPLFIIQSGLPLENIAWIAFMISSVCMFLFVITVFERPAKIWLYAYSFLVCLWVLATSYYGVFIYIGVSPMGPSISSIGEISIPIFLFVVYGLLSYNSFKLAKVTQDPVIKTGFYLVALAAILIYVNLYFYLVLQVFMLNFIAWTISLLALLCIYLGFLMPPWFVKFLKQQYSLLSRPF